MQRKLQLLLILCFMISGCANNSKGLKMDLQQQMNELSKKYDTFTSIGDYVNNSVAIYGCTFKPTDNGGISDIVVKKLYDTVDSRYDINVMKEIQKQPGTVYLSSKRCNGKIYGKIYCFQKEKWPESELHIPCSFIIYDGMIYQGLTSCTRKQFLAWIKKLYN